MSPHRIATLFTMPQSAAVKTENEWNMIDLSLMSRRCRKWDFLIIQNEPSATLHRHRIISKSIFRHNLARNRCEMISCTSADVCTLDATSIAWILFIFISQNNQQWTHETHSISHWCAHWLLQSQASSEWSRRAKHQLQPGRGSGKTTKIRNRNDRL